MTKQHRSAGALASLPDTRRVGPSASVWPNVHRSHHIDRSAGRLGERRGRHPAMATQGLPGDLGHRRGVAYRPKKASAASPPAASRRTLARPMPSKRDVLASFTRQELQELASRFDLEVSDRRSKDALVEAPAGSRTLQIANVADFSRDRLKELCRALGVDAGGRDKATLLSRLVLSVVPFLAHGFSGVARGLGRRFPPHLGCSFDRSDSRSVSLGTVTFDANGARFLDGPSLSTKRPILPTILSTRVSRRERSGHASGQIPREMSRRDPRFSTFSS